MNTHLSESTLSQANPSLNTFDYDRSKVQVGIVHLGPGAFHRAHQAYYTDELLRAGHLDCGICEVSVNSPDIRDALQAQDNLYTLAVLDRECEYRCIGAIKEFLVAPENPGKVIERLADTKVKVVTLTITEKGYCLTPEGGLDTNNARIQHDLDNIDKPQTALGFLVAGLHKRWLAGDKPFVPLSCDNLTDNGRRLQKSVIEFATRLNPEFAAWIEKEVKFPCTMVDSITPATNDDIRAEVSEKIGLSDAWPIQRERFTQWVIEEVEGAELPPWETVGATLSGDVRGYEATKLRILNGMHSSLAFVGLLSGKASVEEAVTEPAIRQFVEGMLSQEIIPTVPEVEGLDRAAYGRDILQRFENPAIRHLLSQIAWDSSQKIPFRILGTVEDNQQAGRASAKLCFALASWMMFIRDAAANSAKITDPMADKLVEIAKSCTGDTADVDQFLALRQIFPEVLVNSEQFVKSVKNAYERIGSARGEDLLAVISAF